MPSRRSAAALAACLTLILAACGGAPAQTAAEPPPTTEPTLVTVTGATAAPTAAPSAAPPSAEPTAAPTAARPTTAPPPAAAPTTSAPVVASPAWMTLPLTDARTGEQFALADFAGRPVYVETMATWCPSCRSQLQQVQAAADALAGEPPVFVALSVETTLPGAQLAEYADANGFTPIFAVVTPELLQALADTFGRTITNPPSTPHFVIGADGAHSGLMTGMSSADEIIALLAGAGGS